MTFQKTVGAPHIIGVGAANIDLHGQSRQCIVLRDSNPGFLHTSAGGVTRNIIENLARQGCRTTLLSAIGDDANGDKIRRDSERAGIDMSHLLVREGWSSSSYLAIMDETGDMFLGMSDMRILETLPVSYLTEKADLLQNATAIVCDGALSHPVFERLFSLAEGHAPVFIDPVSTAYTRNMLPFTGRFYGIKPNQLELSVLSNLPTDSDLEIERAAEAVLNKGVFCLAVSLGARGCYYADANGTRLFRSLPPVAHMVNATGAGDAFMAGFVHGYARSFCVEEQLDYAMASGLIAIHSESTIHPAMSDALIRSVLAGELPPTA